MPFYEYECQSCKFYTEVMQKITDPPLVKCPSCGRKTLQKLISAPVFRLKGSGWYETDFKSDKEDKRNLAVEREESKPAEASKPETPAPAAQSAKPAEKTPSVTTSAAAPRARTAAAKRPAAGKPAPRPSGARAKAKPAARAKPAKAAKRGSRR